jgi:hypothetical protein
MAKLKYSLMNRKAAWVYFHDKPEMSNQDIVEAMNLTRQEDNQITKATIQKWRFFFTHDKLTPAGVILRDKKQKSVEVPAVCTPEEFEASFMDMLKAYRAMFDTCRRWEKIAGHLNQELNNITRELNR